MAQSFADLPASEVDRYVAIHGEQYRAVIARALHDAVRLPRFNPCNFNFDRYVAIAIVEHSICSANHPPHVPFV